MSCEALIYLGLCLGAVVFAAHAPVGQRLAAFVLAAGIVLNWCFVEWTYSASSPQAWLRAQGIPTSAVDLWTVADLYVGVLALVTGRLRWWGWAVYMLCMTQIGAHSYRSQLSDENYTFWLDKMLLAQVAVFFLLGGKGVSDRMCSLLGLHRLERSTSQALGKTGKVARP